jgi:hypothetical protein
MKLKNVFFWTFSLPLVISIVVITIFGSRILINPKAISANSCGDIIVVRNYPLSEKFNLNKPWVRYVQSVYPLTPNHSSGYACREDNSLGQRYGQDGGQGFGAWNISHFADKCISDPIGFVYECQWTAYLFDMFPLRPVSLTTKVLRTSEEECN